MLTLNLSNPKESSIPFKVIQMPDGQQDIEILISTLIGGGIDGDIFIELENHMHLLSTRYIIIKSRFNSWKDLELILCATAALRRLKVGKIHLHIPYLLGARSDREFKQGGTSYLVDVIAPILNSQNYTSVRVIDPHSDVAAACIRNLEIVDNLKLIDLAVYEHLKCTGVQPHDLILVSPDAGALKKIYKVADHLNISAVGIGRKYREIGGAITRTDVSLPLYTDGLYLKFLDSDYLVVDDICDGGKTFIEIAKALRMKQVKGRLILVITHGIFSKGFDELSEYYDAIYCTNSVSDVENNDDFSLVTQLKVI